MEKKQIRIIVIIVSLAILSMGGYQGLTPLTSLGYTTGYQGVRASFAGLDYHAGESEGQEALMPATSFYFDPDHPTLHECNLVGEMTNAFVPEGSRPASWVFPTWWDTATSYINNPLNIYTWELENPNNPEEIIAYEMQEWLLKLYVSVTAEWDEPSGIVWPFDEESHGKRYQNTKVWIELDVTPIWYFEGSSTAYFAIAKVVCSDFAYGKLGTTKDDYEPTPKASVTPESKTSYRYIYYQNFGGGGQITIDEFTYKGRRLNPDLFTDRVFFNVELNDFGTYFKTDPFSTIKKGDAVTWGFDVHIFVVGEWMVQDVEELPDDYGRDPKTVITRPWFVELIENPAFQFWFIIGIVALFFLVLAIFAPTVLFALFGFLNLFKGGRG